MKRLAVLLSIALLFLTSCLPSGEHHKVISLVNQSRQTHGLNSLTEDYTAHKKAQDWAEYLAEHNVLKHSTLAEGMDAVPWTAIGENVGRGPSIEAIHDGYMQSPSHKTNILGDWCCIGAGVARSANGTVYTVQVFFRT